MSEALSFPIDLNSDLGRNLIVDCARYSEKLLDERTIRKRYRLAESDWEALADNEALLEAIEDAKARRTKNGDLKRERAQAAVTRVPLVLGNIVDDPGQNSRHRIDAGLALDKMAANGPESAPAADRFVIQINLGADTTLRFDKSRAVDANDIDPFNDIDTDVLAAVAARKPPEDGSGNAI